MGQHEPRDNEPPPPQPALAISLLGGLRLSHHQQPLPFAALPRTLSLLAYLLLHRGEVVPRARLAFTLWPDVPEETARANLRRHLYDLQRALPPPPAGQSWLHTSTRSVSWPARPELWLDVAEFTALLDGGRADEAVALYAGELLPQLDDEWIAPGRAELHERFVLALEQLATRYEGAGEPHLAISYARRLLAIDPFNETAVRRLMALYAATGSRGAALKAYADFARQLHDDLGLEPLPETQALHAQLLYDTAQEPGAAPAPLHPHPAPTPPHPLVGRERELEVAAGLLAPSASVAKLLTLTGPGGAGKTRLALAVAGAVGERFRDGVGFVPLADAQPGAEVVPRIAAALGLSNAGTVSPRGFLAAALRSRQLLLVLDNCEHLPELAPLVADLLAEAPGLAILATSRSPLGVYGEHQLPIPPLALPPPERAEDPAAVAGADAVALFVARAAAVNPRFALSAANAADVAAICVALDGLPLAIELAAAQAAMLSPAALRARLARRLDLLTNPARTAPSRQQSLRATLDWGVRLLAPEARRALGRLGVFAGGWTARLAALVCADTPIPARLDRADPAAEEAALQQLGALVQASLVVALPEADEPRFLLLETIRAYALDDLAATGELEQVRERHARAMLALAAGADLEGPGQRAWLSWLEREHDNLRAALDWSLRAQPWLALELAGALWPFWSLRGPLREGRRYLAQALALAPAAPGPRRAVALYGLGHLAWAQADYPAAQQALEECLALQRALADEPGQAATLHRLGAVAGYQDQFARAMALYDESLTIKRRLGDTLGIAHTLNNLAIIAQEQGQLDTAERLYTEALEGYQQVGSQRGIALALSNLGYLAMRRGDVPAAATLYRESLLLRRAIGHREAIPFVLRGLAQVAHASGQPLEAARILGADEALREQLGAAVPQSERVAYERLLQGAGAAAGPAEFAAAWAAGRARDLDALLDELLRG